MKFGEVLRTARERKGIDLATAARRLRIRPDILNAIEENDIARMPPRGYSRNMVNAYARLLGLNPTEITKLYLDEAYAYQVGRARDGARSMGSRVSVASTRREARRQARSEEEYTGDGRTSALGRRQYSDARTSSYYSEAHAASLARSRRPSGSDRTHSARGTAIPNAHYTNFYAGPAAPGLRARLPFIIGAIAILVLLIIVLVLVFGGRGQAATSEDVPAVPITGIDDPEEGTTSTGDGSTDGSDTTTKTTPAEPTSVEVTYSVASGASPWIEVYQDGTTTVAQAVNGPEEQTLDVTGTTTIATAQPDYVTVTVDGQAQQWADDDGDGLYTIEIDFASYLEQWRKDNGVETTSTNSTNSSANSSSSGTTTGTNTTSGTGSNGDSNTSNGTSTGTNSNTATSTRTTTTTTGA